MPEMNKITISNIEYTILTYQRPVPEEGTLFEGDYTVIFNGSIYSTDIHEKIGHATNACTYAVTEEVSPDKKTIVRRIYGTPINGSYIPARDMQRIFDENSSAIEAAAVIEEDKQQFVIELHKAINRVAKEVLGKDSVAYDRVRSTYGDWANKYCTPILPEGRLSIPFVITYRDNEMVLMLDDTHSAADIRIRETYVGSKTHGMDTMMVERKSDGAKFDLGRSSWPRYIPRNEETFRKVLDYCKENNNKEILYEIDVLKATGGGLKVGKYRLAWDRRPSPKMTIKGEYCVIPKGEHLVCTDGSLDHLWLYGIDGEEHYTPVLHAPTYVTTVRKVWKFSPTYLIITTYGEIPASSGLNVLEDLWRENAGVIDNAVTSFCMEYSKYKNDDAGELLFFKKFLTEVHNHKDELTGKAEVAYGKYESGWKGDELHDLYCIPILPKGRLTIPLDIHCNGMVVDLRLDLKYPFVNLIKYIGYHMHTDVVVERLTDSIGIDLTHTDWPEEIQQSAENFEKVISMYGDRCCDSINFTMHLSKEQVLEAVGK